MTAPTYDGDVARIPLNWVLCANLVWLDDGLGHRWQEPNGFWIEDEEGKRALDAEGIVGYARKREALAEFVREKTMQRGAR